MAVRVAVHQSSPDRTLAVWLDLVPDLSSTNSTQEYLVDVEHQATDLAVGGSNPSRRAIFPVQHGSSRRSSPGAFLAVAVLEFQHASERPGRTNSMKGGCGRLGALDERYYITPWVFLNRRRV